MAKNILFEFTAELHLWPLNTAQFNSVQVNKLNQNLKKFHHSVAEKLQPVDAK